MDLDVIEEFRNHADIAWYGYQRMINEGLIQHLKKSNNPLDELVIWRVIREKPDKVVAQWQLSAMNYRASTGLNTWPTTALVGCTNVGFSLFLPFRHKAAQQQSPNWKWQSIPALKNRELLPEILNEISTHLAFQIYFQYNKGSPIRDRLKYVPVHPGLFQL